MAPKRGMTIRLLVNTSRACGATVSVPKRSGEVRVRFPDGELLRFNHNQRDATSYHAGILRRQLRSRGACGEQHRGTAG
jgi:hypothetical protein